MIQSLLRCLLSDSSTTKVCTTASTRLRVGQAAYFGLTRVTPDQTLQFYCTCSTDKCCVTYISSILLESRLCMSWHTNSFNYDSFFLDILHFIFCCRNISVMPTQCYFTDRRKERKQKKERQKTNPFFVAEEI